MTPFPMPERTPPVTTTILRSALRVEVSRSASLGGRLCSLVFVRGDELVVMAVLRKGGENEYTE